jgi:hypothetical protein
LMAAPALHKQQLPCDEATQRPRISRAIRLRALLPPGVALDEPASSSASGRGFRERTSPSPPQPQVGDEASRDGSQEPLARVPPPPTSRRRLNRRRPVERVMRRGKPADLVVLEGRVLDVAPGFYALMLAIVSIVHIRCAGPSLGPYGLVLDVLYECHALALNYWGSSCVSW